MNTLLEQIEAADGFILASPANLYTASNVFRRFIEQLMQYALKHRGQYAPSSAGQPNRRPAILISTSATPGWMGRLYYSHTSNSRRRPVPSARNPPAPSTSIWHARRETPSCRTRSAGSYRTWPGSCCTSNPIPATMAILIRTDRPPPEPLPLCSAEIQQNPKSCTTRPGTAGHASISEYSV